jgi:hypothetical protein
VLTDWELWACASIVLQRHGQRASIFVAERIGSLALAGDEAGIAAWKQIAARIDRIQRPGVPH